MVSAARPVERPRREPFPDTWAAAPLLAAAAALGLYLPTLMPGVGVWDTAEFQALGPTLGIAHPTGYPAYTLLLWLASVVLQPFGEPAFRANLLSALLTAGAAAFAAIALIQLTRRTAIALAGGIALAVAPVAWANALRADPHPFHLFLSALLLVLLIAWGERVRAGEERAGRLLVAASAVWALSVGNHALSLLLAPGIALYVLLVVPPRAWLTRRHWGLVLGCIVTIVVIVVATYAYLPIRSSMGPPLDYAHPADWIRTDAWGNVTGGFRYLVLGEQFQGTFRELPELREAIATVWAQLEANLGPAAWLVLLGIPAGLIRRTRETILMLAWFVITWRFSLGYLNAAIERYYLVPILVAVLWAGMGLDLVWSALARVGRLVAAPGSRAAQATGLAASILIGGLALGVVLQPVQERARMLDASGDTWAQAWLDEVLVALPQDAVIVSWWGWSTPLWYAIHVEGRRPDLLVIDDRNVLDDGYGGAGVAIDTWLGRRPVYIIRLDGDLPAFQERWGLEPLPGITTGSPVYRVIPPS